MTKDIFDLLALYHAAVEMGEKAVYAKQIYHLALGKVEHWKNHSLTDLEGEIWKDVVGWEGVYEVSNLGRVYSPGRMCVTGPKRNGRREQPECIIKSHLSNKGYPTFGFCGNGARGHFLVHRVVCALFNDEDLDGWEVNHIDGNTENSCWWNLEKSDRGHNISHASCMGLSPFGERKWNSIFSNKDVLDIFNSTESYQVLADKYKVQLARIQEIKRGSKYSRVTGKKFVRQKTSKESIVGIFLDSSTREEIAKRYGVSTQVVYRIKRGEWYANITKHITNPIKMLLL